MIPIYLCEGDPAQLSFWKKTIENYLLLHGPGMRLHCCTSSPDDLLQHLKRDPVVGLYFLDIDLQSQMNGLQLAEEIRRLDPRGYLVFITTHAEMAPLTFQNKLEAMDFIIKEESAQLNQRLIACIQAASRNFERCLKADQKLLSIKIDGISLPMNQDNILLITTGEGSHRVIFHLWNGTREITGTLREIRTCLNDDFADCNRSTIVNLTKVTHYDEKDKKLTMEDGRVCSVSFRQASELRRKLKNMPTI